MRKFIVAILFLLANFLFAAVDYLSIDQVKVGMKGYMKTVFESTQLTRVKFQVKEISASLFGSQEQPIIWVLAQTNLGQPVPASGQSGSPCWIYTSRGEKFLGLLAFGGIMDKSPIFGITPYEYIEKYLMKNSDSFSGSQTKSLSLPIPINLGPLNLGLLRSDLERIFSQDRFMIMPVSSSRSNAVVFNRSKPVTLRSGSPINVYLTRGDLNIYAHGTVGMVDGKNFIAFGHTFDGFGECDLPVYPARVGATVESYYSPYRIPGSDIGPLIGTITMDSNCGIKGEIGRQPNMIAVSFGFQAKNFSQKRNFEIIKAKITPDYLAMITKYYLSWFTEEAGVASIDRRGMLRVKTTYSFKNDQAPYVQTQVYNFMDDCGSVMLQYVGFLYARILMPIFNNKTMLADLNQIDFEVDVLPDWRPLIAEKIEVKGIIKSGKEIAVSFSFLSVDEGTRYMAKLKVKCPNWIGTKGALEVKTGMNYSLLPRDFKSLSDYLKIQSNSVIFVRLVYYRFDLLKMLLTVIQRVEGYMQKAERCMKLVPMINQELDSDSPWTVKELLPLQKMELWYELKAPIMTDIDVNKIFIFNHTQEQEEEAKNSKRK